MEIVQLLPDNWDNMNGYYLGKDLTLLPFLLDQYKIVDKLQFISLMMIIIEESTTIQNDKVKIKQKVKHG